MSQHPVTDQIRAIIAAQKEKANNTPFVATDEVDFVGRNARNPSKSYWTFALMAGEGESTSS